MKSIFEEYGPAIITFAAVILLIGLIVALLKDDGVVYNAFKNLIDSFFTSANAKLG